MFRTNMQLFTSQDIIWCTGVVWITDAFISCLDSFWRHPFTAEDPLVSKWCNAKYDQICSDEEKLIYFLKAQRMSMFSTNIFFGVKSLKMNFIPFLASAFHLVTLLVMC